MKVVLQMDVYKSGSAHAWMMTKTKEKKKEATMYMVKRLPVQRSTIFRGSTTSSMFAWTVINTLYLIPLMGEYCNID